MQKLSENATTKSTTFVNPSFPRRHIGTHSCTNVTAYAAGYSGVGRFVLLVPTEGLASNFELNPPPSSSFRNKSGLQATII
jgi:hypothetical protein